MTRILDRQHLVEYKTKKGVVVQIGFSWPSEGDVPLHSTLTLQGQQVGEGPLDVVEGDKWKSYDQALCESQAAAEKWVE